MAKRSSSFFVILPGCYWNTFAEKASDMARNRTEAEVIVTLNGETARSEMKRLEGFKYAMIEGNQ